MAWLLAAIRRLREERLQAIGVALLVLVTAFAAAMAPRVLDWLGDTTLRSEIAAASGPAKHLQLIDERRIAWTTDALDRVGQRGAALEDEMPDTIRSLFRDTSFVVESPRWLVFTPGKPKSTVRFRVQPGAAERVRIVEGRLPVGDAGTVAVPTRVAGETREVAAFEVALSVETAARLALEVGETVALVADVDDRLAAGHLEDAAAIVVVGTFEVADLADPFWIDDAALATPAVREISSDNAFYDATVLLGDAAYEPLMFSTAPTELPMRYTWRWFVDPDRFEGETADALLVELRRLEAQYPASIGPATYVEPKVTMRTGLRRLVETQRAGWRSAESALTVAGIGPALVAAAAVALVALLAAQRRRAALALARGRGASGWQVVGAIVFEGLLVCLPAGIVAIGLAAAVLPGGPPLPTILAAGAVVVLTIALLVWVSFPRVAGIGSGGTRSAAATRTARPRRLAAEILVIGLAVGGMVLLRERGVRGASSSAELEAADPFIAAVPALAAVAAGLIAIRLFPLPMRLLAALAGFRRDLVPVLAMRRATRGSAAIPVLLVLLGTATVASFSSATLSHLDRAADVVSWQELGAPYRVSTTFRRLPPELDPASLPGVTAASAAYRATVPIGNRGSRIELLAIEAVSHSAVVAGTGARTTFPAAFGEGSGEPIPAIISAEVGPANARVEVGDTFELSVEGRRVAFRAVESRESFPGLPSGTPFAVALREPLAALLPDPLPLTTLFLRAPDSAAADLRAALERAGPNLRLDSRAERSAAFRSSPVAQAVSTGVAIASIVSAAYAAIAVAASLALAGASRALETAHLRTLGLTRREAAGLGLSEHGPTVLVAFAAGVALGLGLFVFLEGGLGLAAIIGSARTIPLQVELGQLALLLAGIVIIMVVGIGLSVVLGARATPAAAVRRGIE